MKYKDYLQSRPVYGTRTSFDILEVKYEDVMKLPIHYLGLNGFAKNFMVDRTIRKDSTTTFKIKTIGQLMAMDFDGVEYYLMQKAGRNYESILYDIEVALARFSLKLFGSEFTVDDISIKDMNLPINVRECLIRVKVAELGQLRENGLYYISKLKVDKEQKREVLKAVTSALTEFGVKLRVPSNEKPIKVENAAENGVHKIPPIFPKIRESLKAEHLLVEGEDAPEIQSSEPSQAAIFMDTLTEKTPKKLFPDVDYTGKKYDYSKLLKLISSRFPSKLQFLQTVGITAYTLRQITSGEQISRKCLERIATFFDCKPRELFTLNTEIEDKKTKPNDYTPNVDYSKLRDILNRRMISAHHLCETLKIPYHALATALRKGIHLRPEYLKRIANYFGCETYDLATENLSRAEVAERANKMRITRLPEYDYSRLISEIYTRYHVNIDEFGKMINITKQQIYRLKRQLSVNQVTRNRISRKLGIDFDKLAVPIKPAPQAEATATESTPRSASPAKKTEHKQPKKDTGFDYTPLFKMIESRYTFYTDFLRDANISTGIFSRFHNGIKLGEVTLFRLMKFFNCGLEDIVRIENPEIRRQVEEKIKRLSSSPDALSSDYVDYSKIIQLMEQKGITFEQLKKDTHINYTTITKLKSNLRLGAQPIKVICDYLGCKPADVINIEAEVAKKHSFENAIYDYTGLFVLLHKKSLSLSGLLRQLGYSKNYSVSIKGGYHVPSEVLQKLCEALQCNMEDIVVFNEENYNRARQLEHERKSAARKRVVAMHASKILSTPALQGYTEQVAETENPTSPTEVKPTIPEDVKQYERVETEVESATSYESVDNEPFETDGSVQTSDDDTFSGGGNARSGNPNAKFYMSQNGFVNTMAGRVRKYVQKFQQDDLGFEREM